MQFISPNLSSLTINCSMQVVNGSTNVKLIANVKEEIVQFIR